MTHIQLKHADAVAQIERMQTALNAVQLETFNPSDLGRNDSGISANFMDGEAYVEMLMNQYIELLQKNLLDTRANVDLLKRQDEAITRLSSNKGYQPL